MGFVCFDNFSIVNIIATYIHLYTMVSDDNCLSYGSHCNYNTNYSIKPYDNDICSYVYFTMLVCAAIYTASVRC